MAAKATFVSEDINYTAGANYSAGDVVVLGDDIVAVVAADVVSGKPVGLRTRGVFEVKKTNENMASAYVAVYWDADANPLVGTAGSGAAVLSSWLGPFMGWALETAGTSDGYVRVLLASAPPGSGS